MCAKIIAALILVGMCTIALADDPKPRKPHLEDALQRAGVCARRTDQVLLRLTAQVSTQDDDPGFLVVAELGTGDVGVFYGGIDSASDQFIVIDKRQLEVFTEAVDRARKR